MDGVKLSLVQRRFILWTIRTDSTIHLIASARRLVATASILVDFIPLILLQSPRSGRRSVSADARSRYSTKSPGGGSRAYRQVSVHVYLTHEQHSCWFRAIGRRHRLSLLFIARTDLKISSATIFNSSR